MGEEQWMRVENKSVEGQGKLRKTYTEQIFGGYMCNYCKIILALRLIESRISIAMRSPPLIY